jgi:hypothetical protein
MNSGPFICEWFLSVVVEQGAAACCRQSVVVLLAAAIMLLRFQFIGPTRAMQCIQFCILVCRMCDGEEEEGHGVDVGFCQQICT